MSNPQPIASRQSVLLDVARRLSSTQNLVELVDHILQRSREVMDCEVCSVLLPDGPSEDLLIRSTLDPINAMEVRVPKGKGIAGDVFSTKKAVNIEDALSDPRHFRPASDQSDLVTRAMVTIPLLDGDRCLGVMQAINPNHGSSFTPQDVEMFETFGSLIAVTLMRLESQKKAIQEAETRQQLSLASEIQNSFLPSPQVRLGEVAVETFYEPASEVGGDFYFWHQIDDGKILLGVGDVCGKGLPAALDMARGTTLIASTAHLCATMNLAEWMATLNKRLCGVMKAGRFIAINAMLVCPKSRRVWLCCAGLPGAQVFDGKAWREVATPGNAPLGISCAARYSETSLPLSTGRQWMLYTDGILEVQNSAGEYFEDRAFAATLQEAGGGEGFLPHLVSQWLTFARGSSYQDDATILAITDHSPPAPDELALSCHPDTLRLVRQFIETWSAYHGLNDEFTGLLVLGCDEVMSNICKYAYCSSSSERTAACRMESSAGAVRILIEHYGAGITNEDFQKLVAPPSIECRIGGLGLHVISEIFDRVDFRREEGRSVIELVKHL
ncbi:ATP-binding SpoIIE family protein phosphatase [Prosthecobacter fluviatilis]|uniref:SpoIIE family protein phosphatase n=1 Tax=Prosthecobacter fluviatilis TaxID=445931 RepID=A0ABW0KLK3_9BACT